MQMKQTYEVYVNIYDFTSANKVLGCLGLGAYHTGVELKYPQQSIQQHRILLRSCIGGPRWNGYPPNRAIDSRLYLQAKAVYGCSPAQFRRAGYADSQPLNELHLRPLQRVHVELQPLYQRAAEGVSGQVTTQLHVSPNQRVSVLMLLHAGEDGERSMGSALPHEKIRRRSRWAWRY